jgi:hypothetical protein
METAGRCGILVLFALTCRGLEVLDRIAVTIGNQVVTERQLLKELRLAAFEGGTPVDLSPAAKRQALDRLIERELLRRDMELSRFPKPDSSVAEKMLRELKAKSYPDEQEYQRELAGYGLSESDLKGHLLDLYTWDRFVDFRFRSGLQVLGSDIQVYYAREFVPEALKKGLEPVPKIEEVRDRIENILMERRLNETLFRWVQDNRDEVRVEIREKVLE